MTSEGYYLISNTNDATAKLYKIGGSNAASAITSLTDNTYFIDGSSLKNSKYERIIKCTGSPVVCISEDADIGYYVNSDDGKLIKCENISSTSMIGCSVDSTPTVGYYKNSKSPLVYTKCSSGYSCEVYEYTDISCGSEANIGKLDYSFRLCLDVQKYLYFSSISYKSLISHKAVSIFAGSAESSKYSVVETSDNSIIVDTSLTADICAYSDLTIRGTKDASCPLGTDEYTYSTGTFEKYGKIEFLKIK